MELVTLLLFVALLGFLVWLLVNYVPMPQPFKVLVFVIAGLILVVLLLRLLHTLGAGLALP